MKRTTRQKDIRATIIDGIAHPLIEAKRLIDDGTAKYGDFENVMKSFGTYGINGLVIRDKRNGEMYAEAARTSLVFEFDRF